MLRLKCIYYSVRRDILMLHNFKIETKWAATRDVQQCGMRDQQRLRPASTYASRLNII